MIQELPSIYKSIKQPNIQGPSYMVPTISTYGIPKTTNYQQLHIWFANIEPTNRALVFLKHNLRIMIRNPKRKT